MIRHLKTVAVVAAVVALAAGCSSDDSADDTTTTTSASATTSGETDVVAPVIIDGPQAMSIREGTVLDVVTMDAVRVTSSDEAVLEVTQPTDDGSAQFNAGATAVGSGSAVLSVYGDGDELLYEVDITVE